MYYNIRGYLCNYGFCVKKKVIDSEVLKLLKKYFSVKPELNYDNQNIPDKDKYFDVFYQDEKYIILPKFSINLIIDIIKINDNKNIIINDIEYKIINFSVKKIKYSKIETKFDFNGQLREYQKVIINEIKKKFDSSESLPKGGLIKLSCGGGKCLGIDTPILMFDGSIKLVQNINIGDKLMGDDSTPRNILNLARGYEKMYKIVQDYGNNYIVNESHILSLYNLETNKIIDISIEDYLKLNDTEDNFKLNINKNTKKNLYGFRVNILFELKTIEINPYLLGTIIGKNTENSNFIESYFINKYNLNKEQYIPLNYKANIPIIQLEVLAGLIDTLGTIDNNINSYNIETPNKKLAEDIFFILRSLNLSYIYEIQENIHKIIIYDIQNIIIPTKLKKLNILDKNNIKLNNNFSIFDINIKYHKIKVIPLENNEYYGFEIDGNKRFLLGDFTVTHNTMLAIYLSWTLGLKTLVVTHKEFLMDQWKKRIEQFTNARIGYIRQDKIDIKNKDIVIGMLRSLSTKNYPSEILHEFGLVIYDEVHHTGSRVDSQVLLKTSSEYTIGLSATPERSDGMTKIINWHIGDILYEMEKKYNYRVLVKKIFFSSNDILFREKKTWFQGKLVPNHNAMIENMTKIKTRNQLIINFINILKSMGRKILILSYRVEHLELLKNMVDEKIKEDMETHIYNTYYYMGKTKRAEKDMAEKDGHIIFATIQLAEEGLDITHLDTIIFALPVPIQKDIKKGGKIKSSKTLIQSVGRILRNDKLEDITQIPLVVDISDMFSIYSGWSNKRNEIYNKKNWYMQNYHWEDLKYHFNISQNKNMDPMNVIFDDISDEEFIEKNLMLSEEEQKILNEEDVINNNNSHDIIKINIPNEININKINNSYGFGKKYY